MRTICGDGHVGRWEIVIWWGDVMVCIWVWRLGGVIGVVVMVFGIGSGRKVVSSLGVRPRSNMRRDAASRLALVFGGR